MNDEALWADTTGSGFYIFGGVTAYNCGNMDIQIRKDRIWKFTTDGRGGWDLGIGTTLLQPRNTQVF